MRTNEVAVGNCWFLVQGADHKLGSYDTLPKEAQKNESLGAFELWNSRSRYLVDYLLSGRLPRWDQPLVAVSVLKTLCKP
jgi:hypothetical protein